MNQISHYAGQRVPDISHALLGAIDSRSVERIGPSETEQERRDRLRRGDASPGLVISLGPKTQPSGAVVSEAKRILPDLERAMEPMPHDRLGVEVDRFLDMLNAAVANPQDEQALQMRKMAVAMACEGMAAIVWTPDTLRLAVRRFKFFPAAAEFVEFMEDQLAPLRSRLAGVRMVARTTPREEGPTRTSMTPEQREAVRQKAARATEALRRQAEEDEKIRRHGAWMPPGAEGLTGRPLAEALRRAMPGLSGELLAVTRQRVEVLEHAASMADVFTAGYTESAHI
ncbi:MAG: hypothetical protein ABF593_04730 [Acetobacter papayae]|uniref:hypothetical protein n=1 Tax=Acetobacter papayae TaxID=1076592 RepID=UPI0039EB089F